MQRTNDLIRAAVWFCAGAVLSAVFWSRLPSSFGFWGMMPVALSGPLTLTYAMGGYPVSLGVFLTGMSPLPLLVLGWHLSRPWIAALAGALWSLIGFMFGYGIWI